MPTAEAVLNSLGIDEWDASVYGTLATVSHLAAVVRNRANVFRIAYGLHGVNSKLTEMMTKVYGAIEGKIPTDANAEAATPERVRETIDNIERLGRMLEYMHELLRRARLTNNSLTAGQLNSVQRHVEELKDLADWFEASLHSEENNAAFDRAKQERERGPIYDISEVQ